MLIIGAEIESNVGTGIFFHQILFTLKTKKKASGPGSGQYSVESGRSS